jgi:hypothetical protein
MNYAITWVMTLIVALFMWASFAQAHTTMIGPCCHHGFPCCKHHYACCHHME